MGSVVMGGGLETTEAKLGPWSREGILWGGGGIDGVWVIIGVGAMSAIRGVGKLLLPVSTAGAVDILVLSFSLSSGKRSSAMSIRFSLASFPRKRKESAICPENSENSLVEITGINSWESP